MPSSKPEHRLKEGGSLAELTPCPLPFTAEHWVIILPGMLGTQHVPTGHLMTYRTGYFY